MIAIEILFWLAVFVVVWTYFGYFLFLRFISIFYEKKIAKNDYFPSVTLIITAYNEEKLITRKIENSLSVCYPRDKLEILVVSDGSTDRTEEIVKSYGHQGVHLLAMPTRQGKHHGQGKAIEIAEGEVIVFSDATTFLKEDALAQIVRSFADPGVGCVSGMDHIEVAETGSAGEDAYVRYEMKLRELESGTGSLVGVSGCFFAIRRSLCGTWFPNLSSDFYLPILTRMNGYRVVLEPAAIAYYSVLDDPEKEFFRKVRTVVNGMAVMARLRAVLNPLKYGVYSFRMISHKIMRWWVPFCLMVILITGIWLYPAGLIYRLATGIQIAFYLGALATYFFRGLRKFIFLKIPLFFVVVNVSILVAWRKFLAGSRFVTWESTKR
jgi:cellulose synthase/poly-beta-1,6-N-acetylglucosamine synthase-like glycosyltransferase